MKTETKSVPGLWWKLTGAALMAVTIYRAFMTVGPAKGFTMGGHGAKAVFFHVPCAWLSIVCYVMGLVYGVRYLAGVGRRGHSAVSVLDLKCAVVMELGLLFAVLATITGMVFSHNEWGYYWSWDPRQTTIIVALLIDAAYVVLRGGVEEEVRRARICSAYAILAAVPGLFLILVVPRLLGGLHPNQAVVGGGIGGAYRSVLYGSSLPAFLLLFCWLFNIRLRSLLLEGAAARRIRASLSGNAPEPVKSA
jgi:heme exporter protein C